MTTPKNQTQIHPGQYDIIKDAFVEDPMLDIIESFPKVNQQNQLEGAYLCLLGENFFNLIQTITAGTTASISATHLTKLWNGEINLQTTFADDKPNLPVLRVAILQAIIDTLNKRFPQRTNTQPILESFRELDGKPICELDGMPRIRELFKQYMTKTTSGSLERYKLALEILLEKEKLGLPSNFESKADITKTAGFAPGDFSHLDLSGLDLRRNDGQHGDFKKLVLHHCNCDGTNWAGLSLLDADFTDSSLRGADLSNLSTYEGINLSRTDIEGSYFGADYIMDRRAKNHTKISQTVEQRVAFQPQLRQKIRAEKIQLVEIKNINTFKEAYFLDYHSRFFKNPFSTMKRMLNNNHIHSIKEVSKYAAEHPNTRTAKVYPTIPLVTVDNDDLVEIEPSSGNRQQTIGIK